MQVPVWAVRLVTWRWTPSIALVVGSLAFAGVAILIVPDDLGGVTAGTERLSRATRSRAAANAAAQPESMAPNGDVPLGVDEGAPAVPPRKLLSPRGTRDVVQSIFHPTPRTELPIEPVDPEPQPPPPPPPPPPPTATIYTLQNPPPMPTNFVPPPPDPGLAPPVNPLAVPDASAQLAVPPAQ